MPPMDITLGSEALEFGGLTLAELQTRSFLKIVRLRDGREDR